MRSRPGPGLRTLVLTGLAFAVAGCAAAPIGRPPTATGSEIVAARARLADVLGVVGLQLRDPQVPFRPAEGPAFAAAPRAVFQVVLPLDPTHGFVSVYSFPNERTATEAATEQASYLASGPGRVQFPPDTQFVLRQIGPTIFFYAWSPANSQDPRTAEVAKALDMLGTAIPVPL